MKYYLLFILCFITVPLTASSAGPGHAPLSLTEREELIAGIIEDHVLDIDEINEAGQDVADEYDEAYEDLSEDEQRGIIRSMLTKEGATPEDVTALFTRMTNHPELNCFGSKLHEKMRCFADYFHGSKAIIFQLFLTAPLTRESDVCDILWMLNDIVRPLYGQDINSHMQDIFRCMYNMYQAVLSEHRWLIEEHRHKRALGQTIASIREKGRTVHMRLSNLVGTLLTKTNLLPEHREELEKWRGMLMAQKGLGRWYSFFQKAATERLWGSWLTTYPKLNQQKPQPSAITTFQTVALQPAPAPEPVSPPGRLYQQSWDDAFSMVNPPVRLIDDPIDGPGFPPDEVEFGGK